MSNLTHLAMSFGLLLTACGTPEEPWYIGDTGESADDTGSPEMLGDGPVVYQEEEYIHSLESNVSYAKGLGYDPEDVEPETVVAHDLLLDVYRPMDRTEASPVFMWIHGGGFTGGSKTRSDIEEMAQFFASRGWVFVSINYRTTEVLDDGTNLCRSGYEQSCDLAVEHYQGMAPPEWVRQGCNATRRSDFRRSVAMYTAQRDAKAALRWIVANSDTYNLDLDFITVGGNSAGAVTAIALGVSNEEDFRDEIPQTDDPTLATTHLSETYSIRSVVWFWGAGQKLTMFENVYEENRYDSNDPELFMAHGTADSTQTPFEKGVEMQGIYNDLGIHNELVPLDCESDPNCDMPPLGWEHGAWDAEVYGASLSELVFDFLVERQGLRVE